MATWEPDEIDFEDQYDKADPINDADLDTSMTLLNESIREQEELESRMRRAEWKSMNKDERTKLEQRIAFNEKKQGIYIMRALKTIISILHRGFDKIKEDGRVMVLDESQLRNYTNDYIYWDPTKIITRLLLRTKVVHIKTFYHLGIDGWYLMHTLKSLVRNS